MKKFIEGSRATAEIIKLCKPGVISAYPITPQTHIVEELAQMVANGDLDSQFINVESEHSAASVVLGGSATGVRTYTATSSQGLLLMVEVLFNIAGMRLPIVLTCANRAVSAPINIWNDHQDSVTVRDSGWIQLYAENNQEACDLHLQAYKLAENHKVMLPVMVCVDGYILTHAGEIVDIPDQKSIDRFLPKYDPLYKLDVLNPITMGIVGGPDSYMETRFAIHNTMEKTLNEIIPEVSNDFAKIFGRAGNTLIEEYKTDDADTVIVALGSVVGTIKDVADELRKKGKRVGVLKIITHRPFPKNQIYNALRKVKNVGILEKCISLGLSGPLFAEITSLFAAKDDTPKISGFVIGLGGRDVTKQNIEYIFEKLEKGGNNDTEFVGLDENVVKNNKELIINV